MISTFLINQDSTMVKKNNKISNSKDSFNHSNIANTASKIETDDEKRARIRSIWVINIEIFIFAISFSIVMTGVLPYLRQVILSFVYKLMGAVFV